MKKLYYINLTSYIIVMALYISVHFLMYGMIGSIFLGLLQIITALIITFDKSIHKSKAHTNHVKNYWLLVFTILFIILIFSYLKLGDEYLGILVAQIFPMCIATYFVYIMYVIVIKKN